MSKSNLRVTLGVTLGETDVGSTRCYTTYIHNTGHRHLGTCQITVGSNVFTLLTQDETLDITITLVGTSGATPIVKSLPSVVAQNPNWYNPIFRSINLN